ncbi:AAEL013200-PA, partial [Aedes aegypti]
MRWFRVHNYFESLRPLYLAIKLLHFHFETIDFSTQTLHRTLTDQFRFVFTLLLDCYLVYKGIQSTSTFLYLTDSNIVNGGCFSALILAFLFGLFMAPKYRLRTQGMFEILTNIAEFDGQLRSLGLHIDHQRHHFISTVSAGLWMTMGLFVLIITGTNRTSEDWLDLSEMFPDWISILAMCRSATSLGIFTCYITMTLYSLKTGFDQLNQAIAKHLNITPQAINRIPRTSRQTCQVVRKIASLHDLLSDTVELFNECYYTQVVHALTAAFDFTIFSIFSVIHSNAGQTDEVTLRVTWVNAMFDGFFVVYTLQLIVAASIVNETCKRSSVMIHKATAYGRYDRRVVKELGTFSYQLYHHTPKVTCRLFDLDWTLLYTMAGSFATYLVVLLQFDLANLNGI